MVRSKKRLIITLSSLVVSLVVAVVAVVAIFAAMQQNVNSTFRVRYTASQVAATVQANYIYKGQETALVTEKNETSIVFLPTEDSTEGFIPQEFEIDIEDSSPVFEYIFTNDSKSVDVAISLDATQLYLDNMVVEYSYSYERITAPKTADYTTSFQPMVILGTDKESSDYSQLYVYVKLSVKNLANDAEFNGDILWNLNSSTGVSLEFANTDGNGLFAKRYVPKNVNIKELPIPTVDGKDGVFYTTADINEAVKYPFNISESTTVYAGDALMIASTTSGNTTTYSLVNNGKESTYVSISNESTMTFDEQGSIYNLAAGEYIVLESGKSLTVQTTTETENYTAGDTSSITTSTQIPADAAGKMYITRGEYPQTYVGHAFNEVLKAAVDAGNATPTGKHYSSIYFGGDNNIESYAEYIYNGKKYVMNEDSGMSLGWGGVTLNSIKNEGVYIESRWDYGWEDDPNLMDVRTFYLVEPILFKVMEINDNVATVATVNAMTNIGEFNSSDVEYGLENFGLSEFLNCSGLNNIALTTTYDVGGEFKFNFVFDEDASPGSNAIGFDGVTYEEISETKTSKGRVISFAELLKWSGKDIDELLTNYTYGDFYYDEYNGFIDGVYYEEYGYSVNYPLFVEFEESIFPWDIRFNDFGLAAYSLGYSTMMIGCGGFSLENGKKLLVKEYDPWYCPAVIVFEMML